MRIHPGVLCMVLPHDNSGSDDRAAWNRCGSTSAGAGESERSREAMECDCPVASGTMKPDVPSEVVSKWQRMVDLTAGMLSVPAALITRGDPRQIEIFVSSESPGNPYEKGGRVVFDEAFTMYCQIVMGQKAPLHVPNAARDPRWTQFERSPDLKVGMTNYLGYPLCWPDGEVFGTICVLDRGDNPKVERYRELVRQCGEGVEDDLKLLAVAAEREEALRELRAARAELERRVEERTVELQRANANVVEVLESITDGFVALDRDWRYSYVNARAAEILGGSGEGLIGRSVWEQFPEVVGTEGYVLAHRTMADRIPTHFEIYVPSLGRWFEDHVHPTGDGGVSVYFRDITDRKEAQQDAERANERVRTVLKSITDAFVAFDRDWRFTYVNARAAQILGKSPEELLGVRVWDLMPEVVGTEGYNQPMRAMAEGVPVDYETYIPSLGRWFESHAYPTQEGLVIYGHDVTDRKRAEGELRQANARVTEVLESVTDAFVALDREWRFTYVNEQVARNLGKPREELVGVNIWDLFPEEVGGEGYRQVSRAMVERVPVHYEYFVRSVGRWFESHAYPTPEGVSIYSHDITDRKGAEAAARRAGAKVTEVLESITDIFVELDREWRYTYVNDRAAQFTKMSREELIGRSMWDVFPHMRETEQAQLVRRAMADRVPVNYETFVPRFDRWLEVYAYPTGEGGLAFYGREITDRKRAEEALKGAKEAAESASRAKDQFMAVLSHELRTPLTPVLAAVTELEATTDLPAGVRENVDVLRRNVEMEARLIDDLLDVTRIARGKIELHPEVVDVHESLRRAMDICRADAREKGVDLTANLQARRHYVWGDPARLQQVFWNLLTNAVKFTPAGGKVRVVSENEDGRLKVRVADTGVGIDAGMLQRVFNAFEQAERTKVRRYGGLGLGLTIVKNLVELHGGQVTASSEGKDKGAEFTVELTTVAAPPKPKAPVPATPQNGTERQRILLVEDHPDTLRVMSRLLRNLGYAVRPAGSVRAALEAAEKEHFDLLISDLGLPDGSGLEVMRQVKGRYGLRGLAISGFGTEEDMRQSREAGFQQLLTKPVDFNTLETAVREMTA